MKQEPKQETLEEAVKTYYEENIDQSNIPREHYEWEIQDLMLGFAYKWQQKQDKKMYSEEEFLAFGKSCFYKGFEKAENDDANCYTAFREEIGNLFEQFKNR
jgi:hypothetical protein